MTDINKMVQEAGGVVDAKDSVLTAGGKMVGNVRKGFKKFGSNMSDQWRDAKISAGSGSIGDHASQVKDKVVKGATKLVKDNPEFSKGAAAASGVIGAGMMAKKFLSRKKQ